MNTMGSGDDTVFVVLFDILVAEVLVMENADKVGVTLVNSRNDGLGWEEGVYHGDGQTQVVLCLAVLEDDGDNPNTSADDSLSFLLPGDPP